MDMGLKLCLTFNADPAVHVAILESIDKVFLLYATEHADKFADIEPLMAFKNSLVLASQGLPNG